MPRIASFTGNVPAAFGFNMRYLRDAVAALGDDDATVTLQVWSELDPVRIDGTEGTCAVVMPLQL